MQDGIDLDNGAVCLALCLDRKQQGSNLCRGQLRHFDFAQGGVYAVIQVALKAAAGVLRAPDSQRGHIHPFPVLLEGQNLCGLCGLLGGGLPLFLNGLYLFRLALPFKLSGLLCKLPVYGSLAPTIRHIPSCGQLRAAPAHIYPDLIVSLPGLCGL